MPGRYLAPNDAGGFVTNGLACGTARFGSDALTGERVTTISFDGVYSISNLLTTGTAAYTYGTASGQNVPIEPFGTFSAAETPDTPPATMVAKLLLGIDSIGYTYGGGTMTIRNNSTSEFVLNAWGTANRLPEADAKCTQPGCAFAGSGDIRIAGSYYGSVLGYVMAQFKQTGTLTFAKSTTFRQMKFDKDENGALSTRRLVIEEGVEVKPSECNNCLVVNTPSEISGAGRYCFAYKAGKLYYMTFSYPLSISCSVGSVPYSNPPDDYLIRLFGSNCNAGPLTLTGPSDMKGIVGFTTSAAGNTATTLAASDIGCKGTYGNLGDCSFWFGPEAALRYLGAGETMDRDISLTNYSAAATASTTVKLEQYGSGAWNVTSSVSLLGALKAGAVALCGETGAAEATFAGTLADGVSVEKRGTGTWTFSPSGTYTDKITLKGGTLRIGKSMHVSSFDVASGTSTLFVDDGQTLEIDALVRTGSATVDVITGGASTKVKIHGQTAGEVISGVLFGGAKAHVDADGLLSFHADGSQAYWSSAVSGSWSDATKWAGGYLPSSTRPAFIAANGASYDVTVDSDRAITNFTVRNLAGGTARLLVTNGATLFAAGHCTDKAFVIGPGGRLEAVDATLQLKDLANESLVPTTSSSVLHMKGGELVIAGTGTLEHVAPRFDELAPTRTTGNTDTALFFETGTTTFKDDAVYRFVGETNRVNPTRTCVFNTRVLPTVGGETARMIFLDRSHITTNGYISLYELHVGGRAGQSSVVFDSVPTKRNDIWRQCYVGETAGCGELKFLRGTHKSRSSDLFLVGTTASWKTNPGTACFATGIVEVASGASLELYNNQHRKDILCAFVVGHAIPLDRTRGNSYLYGKMTVAGTLQVDSGSFAVGAGAAAVGEFVQEGDGSSVRHLWDKNEDRKGEFVVGAFGGRGSYTLNGGTFSTVDNAYIGGALTNDMYATHPNGAFIAAQHDAEGTLAVNGGSFTCAKRVILGADGTGTLALSGTGTLSAAAIVVSNAVSRLVFTADANGKCGTIAPATKLAFAAGSRVTVDVSAYAETAKRSMRIWNLETAPEGIGDVTFDLVGAERAPKGSGLELSADGRRFLWKVCRGAVIVVR